MTIRSATAEDTQQIATVHVASWWATYQGLLPDDLLKNLSVERRAAYWQSVLAEGSNMELLS